MGDGPSNEASKKNREASAKESPKQVPPKEEPPKQEDATEPIVRPKICCSVRLLFAINSFVAIFNVTYLRVGISMALVAMVVPYEKKLEAHDKHRGEFTWSSSTKGHIISAMFYGLLVGPFLAGFLSFKFGGKLILVIGTICSGALNFFAPAAAKQTPIMLFVVRLLTGFFTGFTVPAIYDIVANWVVPEERQYLVAGALVGGPTASIINFPITSCITESLGWSWVFYILGIWIIFWGFLHLLLVFDHPEGCPFISEKELTFLKNRIPQTQKLKIPWKNILKSLPIYVYFITHFCVSYVHLTIIFSLPMLMESVHDFPLRENGFASATPFLGSFFVRIILSLTFENLRLKLKVSKNCLRKFFVCLGATLASICLLIVTFLTRAYRFWVIGCFAVASSSLELVLSGGYLLSLLDLCPSYVNVISGLANTLGNVAGLISSVVNGKMTPHGTREEWNAVFYFNICVIMVATVIYVAFGKNTLLYWGLAIRPPDPPGNTAV